MAYLNGSTHRVSKVFRRRPMKGRFRRGLHGVDFGGGGFNPGDYGYDSNGDPITDPNQSATYDPNGQAISPGTAPMPSSNTTGSYLDQFGNVLASTANIAQQVAAGVIALKQVVSPSGQVKYQVVPQQRASLGQIFNNPAMLIGAAVVAYFLFGSKRHG